MVREMAPPLQTGDRNAPTNKYPIMIRSRVASLGRSLNVRLVLPRLLNRPHMAKMAVILARGKNFKPGTQSSGRAQYTTKKALSQKNALLVGSAALKDARQEPSVVAVLPLSPMATNPSFSLKLSFPLSAPSPLRSV